jgi:hypothetical protein
MDFAVSNFSFFEASPKIEATPQGSLAAASQKQQSKGLDKFPQNL